MLLITSILATFFIVAIPQAAQAAGTLSPQPSITIDGNGADFVNGSPGGTNPDGYPTTGVYGAATFNDPVNSDTDNVVDGGSLLDAPTWDTMTGAVSPPSTDIKTFKRAAEKINVPDGSGGYQTNDILYMYYERANDKPGSMYAGFAIEAGATDYLVSFGYNPAHGGTSEVLVYSGTTGNWTLMSVLTGEYEVQSGQLYAEAAINLTTLGILPDDQQCRTVTVGGNVATASGGDPNSDAKDIVIGTPLDITNCGALTVRKLADDGAPDTDYAFPYGVKQEDDELISNALGTLINDTVKVGDVDTYTSILAQSDYRIWEKTSAADWPAGWSMQSLVCTYDDIFTGQDNVTVEIPPGEILGFHVPPNYVGSDSHPAASCVITNEFTGIIVKKTGDGNEPDGGFGFEFEGESDFSLGFGDDKSFAATAGDTITITEKALPGGSPAWELTSVICRDASGATVATGNTETQSVDVQAVKGQAITCTFDNNQKGKLIVEKVAEGGDSVFSFDGPGAIDGTIDTSVQDANLEQEVDAGTYAVSEEANAGWFLTSATCDNGDSPGAVAVGAGETVTCTFTNQKAADVTVTKTVSGIDEGLAWEFDFELVPTDGGAAANEANPQTISGTGNVTGSPDAEWTGLEPGYTYSITESSTTPVGGNWTPTWECSVDDADDNPANGFQFVANPGMSLSCDVTNDAVQPTATLEKTVAGVADGEPWSFDFTVTENGEDFDDFTISGSSDGTSAPTSFGPLTPGSTYVVSEVADDDFETILTCTGVTDTDGQNDNSVTFIAPFGGGEDGVVDIVCSALNTASPSSVSLSKTVQGLADGFGWTFDFTLSPDATFVGDGEPTLAGSGSETVGPLTWESLVPGQIYTISEVTQPGFTSVLSCSGIDEDLDGDPENASVMFKAGYDQSYACTATNTAIKPDLTVKKSVTGVDEDYGWEFEFGLSPAATGTNPDTISGTGNNDGDSTITWTSLMPGEEYTVWETTDDDYDTVMVCMVGDEELDDLDQTEDGSVTFEAPLKTGESDIVCEVTNTAKPNDLTLTKYVSGVDDELGWSFPFTLDPATGEGAEQTAVGTGNNPNDEDLEWTGLVPGTEYTLTEGDHTGYTLTEFYCTVEGQRVDAVEGVVTFTAPFGDDIVCDATNTAMPSDLTLTKNVSGVDDELGWSFPFTLDPATGEGAEQTAVGTGNNPNDEDLEWTGLVPGTEYTLTEGDHTGYTLDEFYCTVEGQRVDAVEGVVTFTAPFGDDIVCSATNTAIPSDLTLTKYVLGVDDELGWSFPFTLDPATGEGAEQTATGSGVGPNDANLEWTGLVPGAEYTLTEGDHTGYTLDEFYCTVDGQRVDAVDGVVTFTAPFGDDIVCDATNTAIPAVIEVNKYVDDVDDTWDWIFGFTLKKGDTNLGTEYISGEGSGYGDDTIEWTGLVPGATYTLEEVTNAAYELTEFYCTVDGQRIDAVDGVITFQPAVADAPNEIECFATNRAIPGEVTVTKKVDGIADGFAWDFTFGISPAPEGEPGTQPVSSSGDDSVTWSNLQVGQTYKVYEVPAPGYTGVLTCEGVTDLKLDDDPATVDFRVEAGQFDDNAIECEMVNTAIPSDLEIVKQVENVHRSHEWSFDFLLYEAAVDDEDIVLGDMVGSTSLSGTGPTDSEAYVFEDLVPGQLYAIVEAPVDGHAQILTCEIGGEAVEDLDGALDASVVFEAGLEQYIECTAVNTANPAYAKLIKTVSGATFPDDYLWSFDFELRDSDGVLVASATMTGTGPVLDETEKQELLPYETYTLTELNVDPLNPTPNWVCWDGDIEYIGELFEGEGIIIDDLDGDPDNNSFTFLATPDLDLHCGVINYLRPTLFEAGSVSVTKQVVGEFLVDAEWAFGVTITPQSDPEAAQTATVTGTGPSTSDSTLLWNGLAVGETYVISEDDTFESDVVVEDGPGVLSEYFTTELTCEGTTDEDDDPLTVTFTAEVDQEAITCAVVNTYIPPFVLASTGFGSMGVLVAAAILMMLGAAVVITRRQRGDSA